MVSNRLGWSVSLTWPTVLGCPNTRSAVVCAARSRLPSISTTPFTLRPRRSCRNGRAGLFPWRLPSLAFLFATRCERSISSTFRRLLREVNRSNLAEDFRGAEQSCRNQA